MTRLTLDRAPRPRRDLVAIGLLAAATLISSILREERLPGSTG